MLSSPLSLSRLSLCSDRQTVLIWDCSAAGAAACHAAQGVERGGRGRPRGAWAQHTALGRERESSVYERRTLEHHQAKGDMACTKRGDTHTHTPYRVGEGDTRTPRTIRTQADLTFDDGPGQHVVVGHDIDIGQGGG